jgi:hypothetical protein
MSSIFAGWIRQLRMVCAVLCWGMVLPVAHAGFDTFSVGGDATPASIQAQVDAFRAALGNPNNGNNPGPLAGGRREINWDGGGATMAASSGPTLTAFQNSRGATFTTSGTGFLQTPLNVTEFTSINATYATTFSTFSAQRIFTPVGSNITDATFSIPGTSGATPAAVRGFGVVFSDVDLANATNMELFDLGGASLGVFVAPPDTVVDAGLSFIGAVANAGEQIARVRITTGNSALGPADQNGNPFDVVVMDDVLYSEPVAIPEPASAALAYSALAAAAAMVSRRRAARNRRR